LRTQQTQSQAAQQGEGGKEGSRVLFSVLYTFVTVVLELMAKLLKEVRGWGGALCLKKSAAH
jgi:hypothetical protein